MQNFQVMLQSLTDEELSALSADVFAAYMKMKAAFDAIDSEAAHYCIPYQFFGYLEGLLSHESYMRLPLAKRQSLEAEWAQKRAAQKE